MQRAIPHRGSGKRSVKYRVQTYTDYRLTDLQTYKLTHLQTYRRTDFYYRAAIVPLLPIYLS